MIVSFLYSRKNTVIPQMKVHLHKLYVIQHNRNIYYKNTSNDETKGLVRNDSNKSYDSSLVILIKSWKKT